MSTLGNPPATTTLALATLWYMRNTTSIGMRPFGEAQSKAMRAYAQSENIILLCTRYFFPTLLCTRPELQLRFILILPFKSSPSFMATEEAPSSSTPVDGGAALNPPPSS
ncbi:hypothetical protein SDJN02_08417, partial [Cucurbita argyrosperma subsp. argyrosperma]